MSNIMALTASIFSGFKQFYISFEKAVGGEGGLIIQVAKFCAR